jgi:ABC-type transport system substrate-binding protein
MSRQSGTGVVLSMNVQTPPLSSLEVRRAIFKALDPWDYVDTIFAGHGYASVGIPVQSPDWLRSRQEIRHEHFADPASGRRLLAEWNNGQPVEIELTVRTEDFGQVFLELEKRVASDLMAVGFNPRIRRLNPAQFSEAVGANKKDYQVALGVLPPTSTTNSFLLALLHSGGRWNITGHEDAKLDGMIEQQAVERDPVRRRAQLLDIQARVLDQAYLFSAITSGSTWAINPRVRGFHPNTAISEYIYWSRLWLD